MAEDVGERLKEIRVLLLNVMDGEHDGTGVVIGRCDRRELGRGGSTEGGARGVELRQARDRGRSRIVEAVVVDDLARHEVDGREGVNGKLAIAQRHRAVLEEGLKLAVALVELASLEEDAVDVRVDPIPLDGSAIGVGRLIAVGDVVVG